MTWLRVRVAKRAVLVAALGWLLSLPAACGTQGGGGVTVIQLAGGVIRPSRVAYDVTGDAAAFLPRDDADVPMHVDLRLDGVIPPVKNQALNSCVGWALGYYLMTAIEARRLRAGGFWLDMCDPENWFSPDFIYSQRDTLAQRQNVIDERAAAEDPISQPICFESDNEIGCMRPERALAALMEHGCCRWTWLRTADGDPAFPCTDGARVDEAPNSRSPWQFTTQGSGAFRPRCFVRFGALDELRQGAVQSMQAWLHREGTPIAIVVDMKSGWVQFRGENPIEVVRTDACGRDRLEMRPVCLNAGGIDLGSQHMMTIIGYDKGFPGKEHYDRELEGCEGSFLVVNQWGEKWGDEGYMWIPCAELADIWVGGYGILPGKDIVVGFGSAPPLRDFICVPDDDGKYLNVSADENDVPANLLTACEILALDDARRGNTATAQCGDFLTPEQRVAWQAACDVQGDVPRLYSRVTACRLDLPPTGDAVGLVYGPADVGGNNATTGDRYDSADWYFFDVPNGAGPLCVEIAIAPWLSAGGVPDDIEVLITDDRYVDVGAPLEQGRGAKATVSGPGRFFVKVHSTQLDEREGAFQYGLRTTVSDGACTGIGGPPAPPACVVGDAVPVSLDASSVIDRLYRVPSVPAGADLRVVLSNVTGATPRVQLVVAVFQKFTLVKDPSFVLTGDDLTAFCGTPLVDCKDEFWFREAKARVLGAEGGELGVTLSTALGRGAYLGGRNTRGLDFSGHFPPITQELSTDFEVYVGVRNLTSGAVDCDIHVEACAAGTQGLTPEPAPPGHPGGGPTLFPLRSRVEWEAYGRRHVEVRLSEFCGSPQLLLRDAAGTVLNDAPGFEVTDALDAPGVLTKRVSVPETFVEDVWFEVVDPAGADGVPTSYTLRMFRKASLGVWPLVQDVDAERDGNGAPSRAVETKLSDALSRPLTGSLAYEDYFDFHTLINDTDAPQKITIELRRTDSSFSINPFIFGSHWSATPPEDPHEQVASEFFCAPCAHATNTTGNPYLGRVQFDLGPGEARMIKMQFWQIALQFTLFDPIDYEMKVFALPQ